MGFSYSNDRKHEGKSIKTTIIHGQSHKGSTYNIAHLLADQLGDDIEEFFLPRDFQDFCMGCNRCFTDESTCPHYQSLSPIREAVDEADVIILASPVYVFHATGSMTNLLDHFAYRWMAHRPEEKMFAKQGVALSTAAGMGTKSTNKDMADSLLFWGLGKIYRYGANVAAVSYDEVAEDKKIKIKAELDQLAHRIRRHHQKVVPSIKTKALFHVMRMAQKKGWNPADADYWKAKGWLDSERPWK